MIEPTISLHQSDLDCNYLNPEKSNAQDILLSCINKPNKENPSHYDLCLNTSIDVHTEENIEGFANDHSTKGPGVSYTPKGVCHDGYSKDENGVCNIQTFRGRVRDGEWQRGHHNENMHKGKKNYQFCGKQRFLGLSNGFIMCDKEEENEGVKIEGVEVKIEGVEVEVEVEEIQPYEDDEYETFENI